MNQSQLETKACCTCQERHFFSTVQRKTAPVNKQKLRLVKEEDHRRRDNFSFRLHAEMSVGLVTKWRRKRRKTVGL